MRLFYRNKILLALLEAFGGELENTDCQKLLFLFCQRSSKNHYDFFPHKFGCFSLTSYTDKNKMIASGYLAKKNNFKLAKDGFGYTTQLLTKDQNILMALIKEVGKLRGNGLIKKVYLEYPKYTCRSEIAQAILTEMEFQEVRASWSSSSEPSFFTIGYEGLSIDAYLHCLLRHNVKALLDVRKNPLSMKAGFTKSTLAGYLEKINIAYYHLPNLGVPSHLRQNLEGKEQYAKLFSHYDTEILPYQAASIEELKRLTEKHGRVAITCFEADPLCCHRHRLAAYLEKMEDFKLKIHHLPTCEQSEAF